MTDKAQTYLETESLDLDGLVLRHAGLVKRIAYHLSARLPSTVLVDDLIQAGMMGLLDAVSHYDPSQGASFETYAAIRIRGSMLDELRRNDWAPKSIHRKSRDMLTVVNRIETELGRDAKPKEIAAEMGIELDEYFELVHAANTCRVLNFIDVEYDEHHFTDGIKDDSFDGPSEGLQKAEFRETLVEAIKRLSEREQLIVSLYYDEELNLKEIGSVLGVSESRVSQLLSQAHVRMRVSIQELMECETAHTE